MPKRSSHNPTNVRNGPNGRPRKAAAPVKAEAARTRVAQLQAEVRSEVQRSRRLEALVAELEVYREEVRQQNEHLIEAQHSLEEALARYADLYDFAPVAYVTLDFNGVIEEINLAGLALLGTGRAQVLRVPLLFYVDKSDRQRFLDHMLRCRRSAGHESVTTEVSLSCCAGRVVPLELTTRRGTRATRHGHGAGGLVYRTVLVDVTERRQAELQLLSYQEQLRSLASELALAEERERRRIAVAVHDNLSQHLVLAKMKLGLIRQRSYGLHPPPELIREFTQLTTLVEEALEYSRSLTFELSPPVLYELGFGPALEWMAEHVSRRHGLTVVVEELKSFIDSGPVPEPVAVLLFQAVRELLTNVVKHAQATHVSVRPVRGTDFVRVVVEDNGRGFDPVVAEALGAAPTGAAGAGGISDGKFGGGGFGLFSIRTRLDHLGGDMVVGSTPGGPTTVVLTVPLARGGADGGGSSPGPATPVKWRSGRVPTIRKPIREKRD